MATRYGSRVVQQGLLVHYDVGDYVCWPQSGSVVKDLSGNGNDGRMNAASMGSVSSSIKQGVMAFDGSNDYVYYSGIDVASAGTGNFSVEAFAFLVNLNSNGIIDSDNGGGNPLRGLQVYSAAESEPYSGRYSLVIRDSSGNIGYASGSERINASEWHHVLATKNNQTLSFYQNGLLKQQQTYTSLDADAFNGIGADRIGGSPEGAVNWHGMLGPFRLYNICLTPEQVAQNFHAQRHRFGISGSLG